MKNEDLTYLTIDSVGEVVTNADTSDIPAHYALEARGVRLGKEGMVIERMLGTKKIYDTLPTVPATVVHAGGYRFYNKDDNTEYDIAITTDPTSNYSRVYVYDGTYDDVAPSIGSVNNWIELTRAFTAVVSATPGATTDTTVDINTIKDSLGTTYVLSADELNYYICLNIDKAVATIVTDTSATVTGASVITLPNYAGADGLAFVSGNDLVFFRTNWVFNNFFKADTTAWTGTEINLDLGATPHNKWLPVEAQKKVNLALGTSAVPPVMKNLMRVQLNASRPLFYDGTSAYLLIHPANWYAETIGGLNTYYTTKGSAGTPTTATVSDETVTITNPVNSAGVTGAPFMQMIYDVTHTATAGSKEINLRFAVTLEYDGYQESDPIYRGYFQCAADFVPAVVINSIAFNPATMPKNITAVNFYAATHNDDLTAVQWTDSDADYRLQYSLSLNTTQYNALGTLTTYTAAGVRWVLAPTSAYCYSLTCGTSISLGAGAVFSVGTITSVGGTGYSANDVLTLVGGSGDATALVSSVGPLGAVFSVSIITSGTSGYTVTGYATTVAPAGGSGCTVIVTSLAVKYTTSTLGTLAGRLSHASDTVRTLLSPAYLVKTARDQAAVQVLAKDDTTLRLTCYDGSGVHEDDNLPDVTVDSNSNRQLIALNGKGTMLGLAIARDVIYTFRSTEAETFDLQNGSQQLFDIDFLAKDSLVKSPYGLTWAGRTGIWWLSESSGIVKQINLKWSNLYDGSMMIDDGTTPYITDAYRSLIISGYDPYHKAVIFSYQINKSDTGSEYMTAEYEFEKDRWSFKVLGNSTQAKFFSQTTRIKTGTDWVNGTTYTDAAKLIIGYSSGLAVYPNLTGTYPYTDLENAQGTVAGSGFDTNIKINIKDLNNQIQNASLINFLIDYQGSSTDGTGIFQVEFFANKETTAFDTQYLAIDRIGELRNIGEWGNIDSLRIKLSLAGTTSNLKKWDVSRIVLGFLKKIRLGNI